MPDLGYCQSNDLGPSPKAMDLYPSPQGRQNAGGALTILLRHHNCIAGFYSPRPFYPNLWGCRGADLA